MFRINSPVDHLSPTDTEAFNRLSDATLALENEKKALERKKQELDAAKRQYEMIDLENRYELATYTYYWNLERLEYSFLKSYFQDIVFLVRRLATDHSEDLAKLTSILETVTEAIQQAHAATHPEGVITFDADKFNAATNKLYSLANEVSGGSATWNKVAKVLCCAGLALTCLGAIALTVMSGFTATPATLPLIISLTAMMSGIVTIPIGLLIGLHNTPDYSILDRIHTVYDCEGKWVKERQMALSGKMGLFTDALRNKTKTARADTHQDVTERTSLMATR